MNSERHLGILQKVSFEDLQSGNARFVLQPTASVKLVFRDKANRRRIPGVLVFKSESRGSWISDPNGEVTVDAVPRGGTYTLGANKEGYSPLRIDLPEVGSWGWRGRREVWLTRSKNRVP